MLFTVILLIVAGVSLLSVTGPGQHGFLAYPSVWTGQTSAINFNIFSLISAIPFLVAGRMTIQPQPAARHDETVCVPDSGKKFQMFRSIAELSGDPGFIVDTDGCVVAWSQSMARLTGASMEEMIGQDRKAIGVRIYGCPHMLIMDFFRQPDVWLSPAYENLETGIDRLYGETSIITPGTGIRRVYACKATRLYGSSGDVIGFAETLRDITPMLPVPQKPDSVSYVIRSAMDSAPIGLLILGDTGRLIDYNEGLARVLRLSENDLETLRSRISVDASAYFAGRMLDPDGYLLRLLEIYISREDGVFDVLELADGRRIERRLRLAREDGRITAWVWSFAEIAEGQESMDVFREIHHQVKNNLQIIASLQSLYSTKIQDYDSKSVFQECLSGIRSIAMIYERAYQSGHLSVLNFSSYVRDLAGLLTCAYGDHRGRITCVVESSDIYLNVGHAVPCGLMLTELITNGFKYAYPDENVCGEIRVTMSAGNGEMRLIVADDGIGLPDAGCWESPETLGFQVVQSLVAQVGGRISARVCQGMMVEIVFPMETK